MSPSRRTQRLAPGVLVLARALFLGTLSEACVLVDPAPSLPVVATEPPAILDGFVTPPEGPVLTAWPSEFVLPVQVLDPSKALVWEAFEDYESLDPHLAPVAASMNGQLGDGGAVVTLVIPQIPQPIGPGCHSLKIVVAYEFLDNAPSLAGSDVAAWTYAGNAGAGQCLGYDAGALNDASFATDAIQGVPDGTL